MNIGQALSVAAAALVMAFFTSPAEAQREFLDRAQIHAAVEELADMMEANYVFPDIARAYAEHLRTRLASGAYDRLSDPAELATTMTTDLNGVHQDAHLRVSLAEQDAQGRPRTRGIRSEGAFGDDRWLADGVAYLRISVLPGDEDSVHRMAALLDQYESARVLVLDLRECHGGTQPVMDVILSRLYAEPTRLMIMDTRGDTADMFPEASNMRREEAPGGIHRIVHYAMPTSPVSSLVDAQVFVLTDVTASACEHLASALQSSGRATLVGGATRGAGHYGNHRLFGEGRFQVFVPVGRSYPPSTGQDWEGRGVAPDRSVAPADALNTVLASIGAPQNGDVGAPRVRRVVEDRPNGPRYGVMMEPLRAGQSYVTVEGVAQGAVAQRAGLRAGDRILSLNGRAVSQMSNSDFTAAMRASPMIMEVERNGSRLTLEMALEREHSALPDTIIHEGRRARL